MLLNELFESKRVVEDVASNNSLAKSLVAVIDYLKSKVKDDDIGDLDTVDELLDFFSSNDIILDKQDLYNMIKVDPLKQVISNIKGQEVIWKGKEDLKSEPEETEQEKTVANMAQNAIKI